MNISEMKSAVIGLWKTISGEIKTTYEITESHFRVANVLGETVEYSITEKENRFYFHVEGKDDIEILAVGKNHMLLLLPKSTIAVFAKI